MEGWERTTHRRARATAADARSHPSFSSSLLDAIYRSIDEGDGGETGTNHEAKKYFNGKVSPEKIFPRRRDYPPNAETDRRAQTHYQQHRVMINKSTSSSSESSYGGFSSSEPESARVKPAKPKQERTSTSIKSRIRASKIYGELKKVKPPVSPGGRLASFINQLFSSDHPKKLKVKTSSESRNGGGGGGAGGEDSACSSASSYSRSCLNKTPSSSRKNAEAKRSVRFFPVSVVVGDDVRPFRLKTAEYDDSLPPLPPVRVKNPSESVPPPPPPPERREDLTVGFGHEEEEEEDDDTASYSSSDLFELENFTAIGGDELPVYETTHLQTNRAIAQGLIV